MGCNGKRVPMKHAEDALDRVVVRWMNEHAEGYDDGAKGAFDDLAYGGCSSGMVGELIYTHDVHAFFNRYATEIMATLDEYRDEMGEEYTPRESTGDRMTDQVWFAFEWRARRGVARAWSKIQALRVDRKDPASLVAFVHVQMLRRKEWTWVTLLVSTTLLTGTLVHDTKSKSSRRYRWI